jgi:hypothetical protein
VISNGNGTICGVNNAEIFGEKAENKLKLQVKKDYTNFSTLFEQFVCYSEKDIRYDEITGAPTDTGNRTRACMAVFDPMQIPNRM